MYKNMVISMVIDVVKSIVRNMVIYMCFNNHIFVHKITYIINHIFDHIVKDKALKTVSLTPSFIKDIPLKTVWLFHKYYQNHILLITKIVLFFRYNFTEWILKTPFPMVSVLRLICSYIYLKTPFLYIKYNLILPENFKIVFINIKTI